MTSLVTHHDRTGARTKNPQLRLDHGSGHAAGDVPKRIRLQDQLFGGALAGLVAGIGMYATLAVFAVVKHLGLDYPLHAVHALMSGARVLPDYPGQSLYGAQSQDFITAPLFFFGPALAVGILTARRIGRSQRRRPGHPSWRLAARPAIMASSFLLLSLVVVVWLRDATPAVQRLSTGYGIRQLGVGAWLVAHAVYITLLISLIGPLTRGVALTAHRISRRGDHRARAL